MYMAITSIVSVLVTGRYELAILLPRQDRDAFHIAMLSAGLSVAISAFLLLVVTCFNQSLAELLGVPGLAVWLYWVPASTLLSGIYQSLNYWSTRKSQYKRLAISRTVQSGSAALAQLGSGYAGSGTLGLMSGQIAGQVLSTSVLVGLIWRDDKNLIRAFHPLRSLALAKKYVDFPRFMIFGHMANTASSQMPIFLLSLFFGPGPVGLFSLSQKVLAAPMSLLAAAIGDVFRSESVKEYRANSNCLTIFRKTVSKLIIIGVVTNAPILFLGKDIFSFVFGNEWREAGEVASILSVMVLFQTVASPLGQLVFLANLQKFDFIWQLVRFIISVLSFLCGYWLFGDYKVAIMFYAFSFCALYAYHFYYQYKVAAGHYVISRG